jgi:hypothetical protein
VPFLLAFWVSQLGLWHREVGKWSINSRFYQCWVEFFVAKFRAYGEYSIRIWVESIWLANFDTGFRQAGKFL